MAVGGSSYGTAGSADERPFGQLGISGWKAVGEAVRPASATMMRVVTRDGDLGLSAEWVRR